VTVRRILHQPRGKLLPAVIVKVLRPTHCRS